MVLKSSRTRRRLDIRQYGYVRKSTERSIKRALTARRLPLNSFSEREIEKTLGLAGRKAIEKLRKRRFNHNRFVIVNRDGVMMREFANGRLELVESIPEPAE